MVLTTTTSEHDETDTPLTALCAICHTSTPKYTCPRCNIHTCSLSCVKLHKTRSSCSGIRDPTSYRKRSDLVTASSIDSDFNFITSVERSLARAAADEEREAGAQIGGGGRHLGYATNNNHNNNNKQTDSARLDALVRDRGVVWRRAPKGLKRRRENETRVEYGAVSWTVEFLLPLSENGPGEDSKRKTCLIPDEKTLGEAWDLAIRGPQKSVMGKRKRGGRADADTRGTKRVDDQDNTATPTKPKQEDDTSTITDATTNPTSTNTTTNTVVAAPIAASTTTPNLNSTPTPTNDQHQPPLPLALALAPQPHQNFYLLRPNTPSKIKVLKPIQRQEKMIDILRGRTVLEYPTIYVLKNQPPEGLGPPFMTEETYLVEHGEDVGVGVGVGVGNVDGMGGGGEEKEEEEEEEGEDEEGEVLHCGHGSKIKLTGRLDNKTKAEDVERVLKALADSADDIPLGGTAGE